jgi:hypothetical protein
VEILMANKRPRYIGALAVVGIAAVMVTVVRAAPQGAAMPISQEHHHHLIIENLYLKAYEVEVPPHESTLLHLHDYDYVYIVFRDADITNAVEGKPVVSAHLADTTVNFVKGPLAHVAGNVGDTPFRNVTISLLHKQGEVKIYYPTVNAALEAGVKEQVSSGKKASELVEVTLLETPEIRFKAVQVGAGVGWWTSKDTKGPLLIIDLDRVKEFDRSGPREKKAPSFPADLLDWLPAGRDSFSTSTGNRKFAVLEFKD